MCEDGYEKIFKRVAGPNVKLRQIEQVLKVLHERTADQGLESCEMPRGVPELRRSHGAKAEGAFAQVVDERQKAQAAHLHLIQIILIIQPARPSQTPADGRLVQERLENAGYIRAMIDQWVPGRAATALIAKFALQVADTRPTAHRPIPQSDADASYADARQAPASRRGRAGWSSGRNRRDRSPRRINRFLIILQM
jgi:hypothetical protein